MEPSGLLHELAIDRVLADPPLFGDRAGFQGKPRYVRLHGKPKVYYSSYSEAEIRGFADILGEKSWCIFDNTASSAAIKNALLLVDHAAS